MAELFSNHLLYLAYGGTEFKNEVLSSILSYLYLKKQTGNTKAKILLYTDKASYFQQVLGEVDDIEYVEMTDTQLEEWRGDIKFGHRAKVALLKHALENYGGNVLFLDSDTYFIDDDKTLFEAIGKGQLFMHVQESILAQSKVSLHQTLYRFLCTHPALEWQHVSPTTIMYNSGTVGLSVGKKYVLDDALQLTDTLYRGCPSHIVEQFALSYCLQQAGPVAQAAPYILHYWHMKDARPVLNSFFAEVAGRSLEEILIAFGQIPVVAAAHKKFAWEERPRWQRGLLRAIGRRWQWRTK